MMVMSHFGAAPELWPNRRPLLLHTYGLPELGALPAACMIPKQMKSRNILVTELNV